MVVYNVKAINTKYTNTKYKIQFVFFSLTAFHHLIQLYYIKYNNVHQIT